MEKLEKTMESVIDKSERKKKSEKLTFRLTEDKRKECEDYIDRVGMSLSSLINLAVSEYLEENKLKDCVEEDKTDK